MGTLSCSPSPVPPDTADAAAAMADDFAEQAQHSEAWLSDARQVMNKMERDIDTTLAGLEIITDVSNTIPAQRADRTGSAAELERDSVFVSGAASPSSRCSSPEACSRFMHGVSEQKRVLLDRATRVAQVRHALAASVPVHDCASAV